MDIPDLLPDPRLLPLMNWLVQAGETALHVGELLEGFAQQLMAQGVPLTRASTHIQTLHSERQGTGRVWQRGKPMVEQLYGYGPQTEEAYNRSPLRAVHDTGHWLELRPQRDDSAYGILPELKEQGITHYLVAPLRYSDGTLQGATFATDAPGGFPPEDVELLRAVLPSYSRALELKSQHRMLSEVLRIYVGRGPGGRILSGQVRRGDVAVVSAAMLYADLRGFTSLSNEMDDKALVALLNDYFDCFVPPVVRNGGEILKFIGDAVLAIFPQPEGEAPVKEPRQAALDSALEGFDLLDRYNRSRRAGERPLKVGIALHLGQVAYGNVGSVERQDFTVIGRDVNLISRLAQLCARTRETLLMSPAFTRGLILPLKEMGPFRLKGFKEPQRVFAPLRV